MFCKKCGTQLPDGTKFCTSCGTQLTNAAAPVNNAPTPSPVAPKAAAPAARPAPAKKSSKLNPAILIICLVVVLIIGAAAAVYFTGIYEDIFDSIHDIFNKDSKEDDDFFDDEDEEQDKPDDTAVSVPDTEDYTPDTSVDADEPSVPEDEVVEPETPAGVACPDCGTMCAEDANFCPDCGFSFYGGADDDYVDISSMYRMWLTDCITQIPDTYYTGTSIDSWQARSYKGGFIIGSTYFQHGLGMYSTENSTYTWDFSLPYGAEVLTFSYGIDGLWCYGSESKYGTARVVIFGNSGNLLFDSGYMHGYDDGTVCEPVYVEIDLSGETGMTLSLMTSRGSEGTANVILGDATVYYD